MDSTITIESIIEDCILRRLKPLEDKVALLESKLNDQARGETVEDYMPLSYFIKKYKRSSETIRKVRKQFGRINEVNVLGVRKFSTEQMIEAINSYVPSKLSMGKYNDMRKKKPTTKVKQTPVEKQFLYNAV